MRYTFSPDQPKCTPGLVIFADCGKDGEYGEEKHQGILIFFRNGWGMYELVDFSSRRQARKSNSSTGGELLSVTAAALGGIYVKGLLCELQCLSKQSPVCIKTDAIDVSSTLLKTTMPRERNLAVDLFRLREFSTKNIVDIVHIPRDHNISDVLTKSNALLYTRKLLQSTLLTGYYNP